MIISVAGNILSGKSTLARQISRLYGFSYIPQKRSELNFLEDFFDNIPEHFFATQTSFLVNKISEIEEEIQKNSNLVIDRSLFEDINIFAQLWMDNYSIDDREKKLYSSLSNYLLGTIPLTDVYIYCKCSYETIAKRFSQRPRRSFENKYPPNYIEQLCIRYDHVIFPSNAIIVEIDSEQLDFRDDKTVINLMNMIINYMTEIESGEQLSIFDDRKPVPVSTPHIKILGKLIQPISFGTNINVKKKVIYLAAPFTEFAKEESITREADTPKMDLNIQKSYGILSVEYQNLLKKIKKYLSFDGQYEVILPHKDENNWGKRYLSNEQILDAMIVNIKKSDLIFAIVTNSIGVHMEFSMMLMQDKPMVLIIIDEKTDGFYADGLKNKSNVLVINVNSMNDIKKLLKNDRIENFIQQELNNEKSI
ncbi:MAG: deoxynucleoside kinase [Clostridia bacterium]|nr:deoxynucleoside kinase [Clostridia bacterium]